MARRSSILFLIISLGSLPFVITTSLFGIGKEYQYSYETLVTAGQEQPTSFASAFKIKGVLRVNAISETTLSVGLDNLTIGLYNGPWTYFPIPDFKFFDVPDLSALGERFHIVTENGKFKTLILNDLEPEWASNMKRGLATFLQLDFESITSYDTMQVLNIKEMTTMGECSTKYEVLPASTTLNRMLRVNKFRNHADCPDMPKRTKQATQNFYQCSNANNRDIINSTAYAVYELEIQEAQPLLKGITLYSSILAWPFTSLQSYQFSWLNMTISFNSAVSYGNQAFPPPENAENHEDLMFSFEQPDPSDPEDENPDLNSEAILFHHSGTDTNPEVQGQIMEMCHTKIAQVAETLGNSEPYLSNLERFHGDSPLSFIPIISALDYDHLTQCYKRYSDAAAQGHQKLTELQLFLDGLILSGTSQSSLVLRDVLLATQDVKVISRIATAFPHFIRNPTEAIATETDLLFELLNNSKLSPSTTRMLEFSTATLIGRCCKKTLCTTSGLLDKYIIYFENKLAVASNFEERTSAILGLRNLAYGRALDKVLEIATGANVLEQTTRIQAIWALSGMDPQRLMSKMLPVFYNRTELCETRTTVFTLLMSQNPDERILHDIAYFMWSEHCPQTYNIVRSFLANAVKSKSPCNRIAEYARTILNYLPPGVLDPLRTSIYTIDYFDSTHGLGHEFYSLVQKSGASALPTSVFFGVNNYIGGFAGPSMGCFIRMEGLEKAITSKIALLKQANIEQVQKILAKIDVTQRPTTPLRLEFILIWQNRVIVYYAADEKTISSLPAFLSKLTDVRDNIQFSWEQSSLFGGAFYQQPLEIGTPVSISFGVVGTAAISTNITQPDSKNIQRSSYRTQFNLFAKSAIANHVPVVGTIHAVTTHRTLRLVLPRSVQLQLGDDFKLINDVPSENDPILVMAHGTSMVTLVHDSASNVKQKEVTALLQKSCPACRPRSIISRGEAARKSRFIYDTPNLSPVPGLVVNGEFFDCERDHSRQAVVKRFKSFYSDVNKNTGVYNLAVSKWFLTSQQMLDYLFWSPSYETCGLRFVLSQDGQASKKLESVEYAFHTELQVSDPGEGGKLFNGSFVTTTNLIYSQQQKSTIKTVLDYRYYDIGNGTKEVSTKFQFTDHAKQTTGSVCVDYSTSMNHLPKDVLSYENENEPYIDENIKFKYGRVATSSPEAGSCLSNVAELKINGRVSRSYDQVSEAQAAVTSPYRECQAQKGSGQFFGSNKFTPPTLQCFAAVLDQTSLRNVNATIYYKISKKIPEKWKRKFAAAARFIYPMTTPDDSEEETHPHTQLSNELVKDSNFHEGFIEADINIGNEGTTTLDVHSQASNGKELGEEQHSHGIILNSAVEYLRPKPIPARFSPYLTFGFKSGFLGQCTANSAWVSTLDNIALNANISECPTLLSADCGPNPQYAVLVNKISAEKIGLSIQIGDETVDLKDISDTVTLNGKQTKIPNQDKYAGTYFELLRNDDEIYLITRLSGIHIRYTGYFATITLDSRFRGVHCGICGHWDYSFYNDMMGPNTSCPATAMVASPQEFVNSYVVGDDKGCKRAAVVKCGA